MATRTSRIGLASDTPLEILRFSRGALQSLRDLLMPNLARLPPPDPRAMPDMRDESAAFVHRALGRADANLRRMFNADELDEWEYVTTLKELHELKRALGLLEELVEDGLLPSGGESAAASAAFFEAVKAGSGGRGKGVGLDEASERVAGRPDKGGLPAERGEDAGGEPGAVA